MYKVVLTRQAQKDLKKLKETGLSHKAKALADVVAKNPFQNPPAYEEFVGNLSGLYSRRINIKHRFVYRVIAEPFAEGGRTYDGTVVVASMWSHYESVQSQRSIKL